jgi:site-specific DNA recombinase
MSHTFCTKNKRISYRYYRCVNAMKNGHDVCPTGMLPAEEIERVVIDEIRGLVKDEALLAQVLTSAHAANAAELAEARRECDQLQRERDRHHKELRQLATGGKSKPDATARVADLHQQLLAADKRLSEFVSRIAEVEGQTVPQAEARAAFADFDGLWGSLIPREQARLLKLLIEKVEYDGKAGTVSVTFRPTNIGSLINRNMEDAA